jgi:hypothetical protein
MNVNQFMPANVPAIQTIINQLERPFDTHAFPLQIPLIFQRTY